jgi:hypothetical protein
MKKRNPKLSAKVQALNNELKSQGIVINKTEKISENKDLSKQIIKDLYKTIILIIVSFGILLAIKYLNTNFSLNKFF